MYSLIAFVFLIATVQGANHPDCGTKGPKSNDRIRIVGGTNAEPLEFPWQGSLRKQSIFGWYHTCGCSILNEGWILTAAHCVDGTSNPSQFRVRLGEHDTSVNEGTEIDLAVTKIIQHPEWDRDQIVNDVALLKLTNQLNFQGQHKYLNPVCLPDKEPLGDVIKLNPCIATGWGNTQYQGSAPKILQKVSIDIVDQQTCSKKYEGTATITDGMICFGENGKGTCNGDSGGPLVCRKDGKWFNYGTTSFGVKCADDWPSVDARNSEYSKWIWNTIDAN